MKIDVTSLLTGRVNKINIDELVELPIDRFTNTRINSTKDIKVSGTIKRGIEAELELDLTISGVMVLNDDLTLDEVDYGFKTMVNETIPDNEYVIYITDIILENIIMEIPSKVRGSKEQVSLSGDGWRLLSEEEYDKEHSNNPFRSLSDNYEKEE